MSHRAVRIATSIACVLAAGMGAAQSAPLLSLGGPASAGEFPVTANHQSAAIYAAPRNPETVRTAVEAFASDVAAVTGTKPRILTSLAAPLPSNLILVGVLGQSPEIDALVAAHRLDAGGVAGHWEAALTETVTNPIRSHPEVKEALVIAGADRRGAAFALFTLSREMGVSPWAWWADVPVARHSAVYVTSGEHIQPSPSVQYRGIFLNDEDWGLRVWAAKKMDPTVDNGKGNIGPHTYERIFELLLRLHANSLWPAMHPGSLAFNAVPENAKLADKWGIVMGSSHSEALLRNNVGEWNEKTDGPWNYQVNAPAMRAYWDARLAANGQYENFYTVGLRGVHDSGLEATGTPEVKARLVEQAMADQRKILAAHIAKPLAEIPQIIWLYKESLDLYRAGMKVPEDVTLGWTDDNYGYIRELPDAAEQARPGGSGVYYHVSYWGSPHDYLWLCTTPPALIREEMTKAYDHNARKYWILNVGDLKPAEIDIDYFLQLAWDEPGTAALTQREFLTRWASEQFSSASSEPSTTSSAPSFRGTMRKGGISSEARPVSSAGPQDPGAGASGQTVSPSDAGSRVAGILTRYYALNFIRKPEFMGFNGYNDNVNRTAFNPLAWGRRVLTQGDAIAAGDNTIELSYYKLDFDQNHTRSGEWSGIRDEEAAIAKTLNLGYSAAFFELVGYPVEAAAAMNDKFLFTDLTYLDAHHHNETALASDTARAHASYDTIQTLTAKYNSIEDGKWDGILSDDPRNRHVFEMPRTATMADADKALPGTWGAAAEPAAPPIAPGFVEQSDTVSINAAHFARKSDGALARWNILPDLGISGASVVYGAPGLLANASISAGAPWLEYDFTTISSGPATLTLHLLPTFPVDSAHRLRYAVSIDGHPTLDLDAAPRSAGSGGAANSNGDGPSDRDWPQNVLRNSAIVTLHLSTALPPGAHTVRLYYRDPGVVFEHLVLTFAGAPPAYPVPPETTLAGP